MVRHCLWKMCATPDACINETALFISATVVPQSKSTELSSSSAAVVPHDGNLPSCVVAAVVPQSKSTELCSSAAPFHISS